MYDNTWRPDRERNQEAHNDPAFWMTRALPGGWRISVRLFTNSTQTVIDHVHVEPTDSAQLRGIRGHIELPTGDPADPTWHRVTLPTARREASSALEHLLQELHRTSAERQAAYNRGDPPPADRREPINRALAAVAEFRGFTTNGTRPPRRRPGKNRQLHLAIIAAAYSAARAEHPTRPREATQRNLEEIKMHHARSTIGPQVNHARAADMLTRAARGRAGGELTHKARQLLADADFHAPWYTPTVPPGA